MPTIASEEDDFLPADQFLKTLSEIPAPAPVGRPSLAQLRGIRTKIDVFENKMAPAVRRGALSGTGIGANRKGAPSMPVLQEDLPAEQSASKATEMTPGAQRRQSLRAQAARFPSIIFKALTPGKRWQTPDLSHGACGDTETGEQPGKSLCDPACPEASGIVETAGPATESGTLGPIPDTHSPPDASPGAGSSTPSPSTCQPDPIHSARRLSPPVDACLSGPASARHSSPPSLASEAAETALQYGVVDQVESGAQAGQSLERSPAGQGPAGMAPTRSEAQDRSEIAANSSPDAPGSGEVGPEESPTSRIASTGAGPGEAHDAPTGQEAPRQSDPRRSLRPPLPPSVLPPSSSLPAPDPPPPDSPQVVVRLFASPAPAPPAGDGPPVGAEGAAPGPRPARRASAPSASHLPSRFSRERGGGAAPPQPGDRPAALRRSAEFVTTLPWSGGAGPAMRAGAGRGLPAALPEEVPAGRTGEPGSGAAAQAGSATVEAPVVPVSGQLAPRPQPVSAPSGPSLDPPGAGPGADGLQTGTGGSQAGARHAPPALGVEPGSYHELGMPAVEAGAAQSPESAGSRASSAQAIAEDAGALEPVAMSHGAGTELPDVEASDHAIDSPSLLPPPPTQPDTETMPAADNRAPDGVGEAEFHPPSPACQAAGTTSDSAIPGQQATSSATPASQGSTSQAKHDRLASPAAPSHTHTPTPAAAEQCGAMVVCMPGAANTTVLATPAGGNPGHPGGGAGAGTPASAGFHLAAELAAVASSVHRGSSARSGSVTSGDGGISPATLTWYANCGPSPQDWVTRGGAATPLLASAAGAAATPASAASMVQRPEVDGGSIPSAGALTSGVGMQDGADPPPPTPTLQFTAEVARMLQALEAATPATLARRPHDRPARYSLVATGTLLDMESYDASGARQGGTSPSPAGADPGTTGQLAASGGSREPQAVPRPATSPTPDLVDAEVTALRDQVARLERWGLEAGTLLSSYQQTVAELEDRHSAALVACQAQLRCLTAENRELEARCSEGARAAEERILTLERQLASAQTTAAATQQELQALQVSHQAELANERAAAALQLQLRGTQHDAELGKVRAALDRSTSELAGARERQEAALHQAALARAARDRASAESARREDEVVGLRVRLEGLEASLGEYRAENAKAAGMKARYKAIIGELEASLGAKEREKSALVAMCDELMTTLERERQQLARQQAPR
ncbi:hypothetical protein ACKKBG_A00885 [Auxenochlorella protothecoides x Auxenochlorella symbiontica]